MLNFFKNLDFSSLSESFRKDAKSAFIVVLMLACMYFIHGKSECQEIKINIDPISTNELITAAKDANLEIAAIGFLIENLTKNK